MALLKNQALLHSNNQGLLYAIEMTFGKRLQRERKRAAITQADLATSLGISPQSVSQWERGETVPELERVPMIARILGTSPDVLLDNKGTRIEGGEVTPQEPPPNARIGPVTPLGPERIPVYGHAVGGDDGRFVMNGQQIDDVLAPPSLRSVPSAYAVYVVGESMEPRYYAGETVFVHPYIAVRRGDFVVVEIDTGDGERLGFVKRFVSRNSKTLVLEQFNPAKQIVMPTDQVISVHRIVMGGDG